MTRIEPHLILIFSGTLSQTNLDRLRSELGLERKGRLTDREDERFGIRYLDSSRNPFFTMGLWREKDNSWYVTIDAEIAIRISTNDLETWETEIMDATKGVGLAFVERRSFQEEREREREREYKTRWRNENWMRTSYWDLPASTLEELWPILGAWKADDAKKRAALRKFMESPTWEPAPERIKREASEFLSED